MTIRPATPADFEQMWRIFQAVVAGGDTYVFAPNTSREVARTYFLGPDMASWVAELEGPPDPAAVTRHAGSWGCTS